MKDPEVKCLFTEMRDPKTLRPHPRNYNRHHRDQIRCIAKAIARRGWRWPIVVSSRTGYIVKGHGRHLAAVLAEWAEVPVEVQEYRTEKDELEDLAADNRLAELADPDLARLKDIIQELDTGALDLEAMGFTDAEAERLMTWTGDGGEGGGGDGDKVTCPKCGHAFDAK